MTNLLWKVRRAALFPQAVLKAAQASQRATGIPACVILGQWAHESAFGRALSGNYNYFGIKWRKGSPYSYKLCKTWEVYGGKNVVVMAPFVSFPSLEEAFRYHGRMLMHPNGYYTHAFPFIHDWKAYVKAIAKPYATDPHYATKVINIIDAYHLYDYNLPK